MAEAEEVIQDTAAPEVETQAREMGWRPKDEYKGDEEKWVDAKTFVDRGEHILPIVKATNKRLRDDLTKTNERLNEVMDALKESKETIDAMERYHQEDIKQKVERTRKELKDQLVAAKKAGDVESEVDLTDEISRLNSAENAAEGKDNKKPAVEGKKDAPDYTKHPDWVAWKEDNPWFGVDRAKTAIAYDISAQLRNGGETSQGREFMDKVTAGVAKEVSRLGGGRSSSKVEGGKGGSGGNGGSSGGGRSWNDLPSEAKEACRGYERELVGENKRHKTVDAWRKVYTEQYFADLPK